MKKLILLSALFICFITFAQAPQGISYQAIALNGSGTPVASSNVRVKLSILDTSATGTVLYSETQLRTTSANGLFNLTIGQGTVVSGVFASINWGVNSKFLKVEMDATGGTTYVAVGTTQLLSVPYAMFAASTASLSGIANVSEEIIENQYSNLAFIDYSDNKVYVFNSPTSTWSSQTFNPNSDPSLETSNGNVSFVDYSDSKVYVYNGKTGVWSFQSFNPNADPDISYSLGSISFIDFSDNKVYVYNRKTGVWSSQAFNPNSDPTLHETNGNIAFIDYSGHKVFVFYGKSGTWSSQTFNVNSDPSLTLSNGSISFVDYSDSRIYVFNNGTWSFQAFNPNSDPAIVISSSN